MAGGGWFDLRFAEVDNRGPINLGVDNVSVVFAVAAVTEVPEPGTLALLLAGVVVLPVGRRRRRRRA